MDGARWMPAVAAAALALGCGGNAISTHENGAGGSGGGTGACGLAHEGDLVVRTPAELEALREHRLVSGDLIVECPECTTLEPLSCLEEVGKMLSIVGCDRLESLDGLSALRRLGLRSDNGGLGIGFYFAPSETRGNARLRTLDGLGPLELVEGRIHVSQNPELRDLSGIRGLSHVAGSLFVEDNDALASLEDLSELRSLRGSLEIADDDALVDLRGLESLAAAATLWIRDNDALVTLAGLDSFRGEWANFALSVLNNPLLADVTALGRLSGTLRDVGFRGNASLREVRLDPGLAILSGALGVSDNAALEHFEAPGLTHVGQAIYVEKNPALVTLNVGAPASVGGIALSENGALSDTSAFAEVRVVAGEVRIQGNQALERITLPELQEIGGALRIESNPVLGGFELGALRRAERVDVRYNPLLPSCLVETLVSSIAPETSAFPCDNAPDDCARDCPPRP